MLALHTLILLLGTLGASLMHVNAFTPSARWGASSTVYTPSTSSSSPYLLVLGGRADPSLLYTYSSAPALSSSSFATTSTTDSTVLALDLSANFTTASPAWLALDDSTAPTSVWGVLGGSLVYGGDGGTGLAVQTGNDSLYSFTDPTSIASGASLDFAQVASGTGDQPIRMIYSAISTSADGTVSYITGGEKDDGSGTGFATAYSVSTSSTTGEPTFTALPDLPTELCHHKMVLLGNGTLITVGGYVPSTSTFMSMHEGYSLDTTDSTAAWVTVALGGGSTTAPAGRRGHSAVLLNVPSTVTATRSSLQLADRRSVGVGHARRATTGSYSEVLAVYGGTSGSLLGGTTLSDLWTLNLSSSSPIWTSISSSASAPSARMDAVAQPVGYQLIIFGGYGTSAPSDDGLYVYNALTSGWEEEYDSGGTDWTPGEIVQASEGVVTGTSAAGTGQVTDTGTGATTRTMGPTVIGFATGKATAAPTTTGTWATTTTGTATSGSQSMSSPSASSTGAATAHSDATSRTLAVALGTSLSALAAIAGLVVVLFLVKRRKRDTHGRFRPYGSRNAGYRRKGDGAEGLMTDKDFAWQTEDYLALGGEKRMGSINAAGSEYSGVMPGTIGGGGGPVAMARYSAGERGVIRRDMLEDEDRSYRRHVSGSRMDVGDDEEDSASMLGYGEGTDLDQDDNSLRPMALYRDDSGQHISSVATSNPSRPRNVDPFEDSYGAPVLDYVYGDQGNLEVPTDSSRNGSHSPVSSVGSQQGGSLGRVQTARKVSLAHQGGMPAEAVVVPVKRGESMLKRLNIPSFFGGATSRSGFVAVEEGRGFMDPSTPPAFTPLLLHDGGFDYQDGSGGHGAGAGAGMGPSARRDDQLASDMSRHGRSVSSVVTARTADSEALDRYQRMNIVQRERTSSSGRDTVSDEGDEEVGRALGIGGRGGGGRTREEVVEITPRKKSLPARPVSPTRPRTVHTPRGPRPVSPTRHQPASPIRAYITAPTPVTPSRRHVRDMAASINRRDSRDDHALVNADLFVPSPMMASAATLAGGVQRPGMLSPSRGIGFGGPSGPGSGSGMGLGAGPGPGRAMGPRGPKKVYEYQERGELRIANR